MVICLVNPQNGTGLNSFYPEIHYIEVRYIEVWVYVLISIEGSPVPIVVKKGVAVGTYVV